MKTKNRLLLTSAMMLALVAVSGTTATYAWWVTTLQASASVDVVTATADANLTVKLVEGAHTRVDGTTFKIVENGSLTDVTSGDGQTFSKATLDSNKQVTSLVKVDWEEDDDKYATNIYYAISFGVEISMPALNDGLMYNVYLGDGLGDNKLIDDQSKDKSVRMAVTDGTEGNVLVFGQNENDKYQTGVDTTGNCKNYQQLTDKLAEVTTDSGAKNFGKVGDNKVYCLGNLDAKTDVLNITFSMWFEGNLTQDTVDGVEQFKANLYFYALKA